MNSIVKITFFFSEYSTTLVYGSMSVTDEKLQNQETFFLEKCFREIVLWPNDLYVYIIHITLFKRKPYIIYLISTLITGFHYMKNDEKTET